jgi:molybdate transport system substrate-binding protein
MKKIGARIGIGIFAFVVAGGITSATAGAEESAKGRELVIFAAASLKETFERIAKEFEAAHAGSHVVLQLAGSQELRTQIENGAAADVFASADLKHMTALHEAKLVGESEVFARNEPVLVTPAANPAGLGKFEDLPKAKKLIVGVDEVPIGKYTRQILDKAAKDLGVEFSKPVEANIASRELNVRQILAKVSLGEGDAGFVYRTDAATAGEKVEVIEIPTKWNVIAEYPIAVTTKAPSADLAKAWVALVVGKRGQEILASAGFKPAAK